MHGLLHAVPAGQPFTDLAAAVVFAIRNDGPAMILAGLGAIDFIAALRTMFMHPQLAIEAERRSL